MKRRSRENMADRAVGSQRARHHGSSTPRLALGHSHDSVARDACYPRLSSNRFQTRARNTAASPRCANVEERTATMIPDHRKVSIPLRQARCGLIAQRQVAAAVSTEDVPEEIVQLARVSRAGQLCEEHDRVVDRAADRHIFIRGDLDALHELPAQLGVDDLDSPKSQVTANLVVIHWRPQFLVIDIAPQTRSSRINANKNNDFL